MQNVILCHNLCIQCDFSRNCNMRIHWLSIFYCEFQD